MACDTYTVLMVHADEADTSTSFPDSSNSAHTVTPTGDAQNDTAQAAPLVGSTASALFDGNDYLTTDDTADWDFGTGDFTVDFWARSNGVGFADHIFMDVGKGITTAQGVTLHPSTDTRIDIYINGSLIRQCTGLTLTADTWYHFAIVRTGTTVRAFQNGTQIGTDVTNSSDIQPTTGVVIGARGDGLGGWVGWIDEFRVSKGIARWTTNFTPPTVEYCVGGAVRTPRMALLGVG